MSRSGTCASMPVPRGRFLRRSPAPTKKQPQLKTQLEAATKKREDSLAKYNKAAKQLETALANKAKAPDKEIKAHDEAQAKELLEKKFVGPIEGFKSRFGKDFTLFALKDGHVKFEWASRTKKKVSVVEA